MKHRVAAIIAVASTFVVAGAAMAQGVQNDVAVTRSDIQADRQAIVSHNMKLTDAQASAFWPVYREYRNELAKQGDRIVKLVSDYGAAYDTLTDAQATAMMTEYISIQKDSVKIKDKYISKFGAVLPPKLVMRFYQIENKLDTILMVSAVDGIPLAK